MPGKTVLVFWSGGIDSTALMCRAVELPPQIDLRVHHIRHINAANQHGREWSAVQRMLPHFRQRRPFTFTTTTIDMTEIGSPGLIEDAICFTTAQIVPNLPGDTIEVWEGTIKDDLEREAIKERFRKRGTMAAYLERVCWNVGGRCVILNQPLTRFSKREVWEIIPPEIRKETVSCASPAYGTCACGRCSKCRERKDLS